MYNDGKESKTGLKAREPWSRGLGSWLKATRHTEYYTVFGPTLTLLENRHFVCSRDNSGSVSEYASSKHHFLWEIVFTSLKLNTCASTSSKKRHASQASISVGE